MFSTEYKPNPGAVKTRPWREGPVALEDGDQFAGDAVGPGQGGVAVDGRYPDNLEPACLG